MSNYAKYSNPEFDDLVSQAKKETDPQKAAVLMRQADDLACSEYPLINLYYRENQLLLKPYIQGAFLNAKDHLYFKTAEIVR
jgi:oligopeptide transport system substrate-binding protein